MSPRQATCVSQSMPVESHWQPGAGRLQYKTNESPLGEREPGANPGQACCCNGPRDPDEIATAQAGRRWGGRSQKTGRAGGIVLTNQEPMQHAAPSSAGSRLCPFVRDMTGGRLRLTGAAWSRADMGADDPESDGRGHVVERRQGQRTRAP